MLYKLSSQFKVMIVSFVIISLLSISILLPVSAQETTAETEETTQEDTKLEAIEGNYSVEGGNLVLEQEIDGDLFATGDNIEIKGRIRDNLFAAGNSLIVSGKVSSDAFVAGSQVRVNEDVSENLFAAGSAVQIDGEIGNDGFIAGNAIVINGDVDGDLRVAGSNVYINSGKIDGDLEFSGSKIFVGLETEVEGKVLVNGTETNIDDIRNEANPVDVSEVSSAAGIDAGNIASKASGMALVFTLLSILGSALATWVLFKLFPVKSNQVIANMNLDGFNTMENFKYGILAFVLSIVLSILLGVSIVGWPILVMLGFLTLFVFNAQKYYFGYKVGQLIIGRLAPSLTNVVVIAFIGTLVSSVVMFLIALIPTVGAPLVAIIGFIITIWGVGAITRDKFIALRRA